MPSLSQLPNAICILRIILVAPIVAALSQQHYLFALVLIFIAGFSDGLDGFLAKRFDWRSRLGGILDPLADKILLMSVFLTLTVLGLTPVWLAAVVVVRDVVIVFGALAYNFCIGQVDPRPTRVSKLNTGLQLLYILFIVSRQAFAWPDQVSILVMGAGVLVTSVVSGLDYVLRWGARALAVRRA